MVINMHDNVPIGSRYSMYFSSMGLLNKNKMGENSPLAKEISKLEKKEDSLSDKQKEQLNKLRQKHSMVEKLKEKMKNDVEEKILDEISQKVATGEYVSQSELNYLKEKNPDLYKEAKRVSELKEGYENRLRNAKSKEEAEEIMMMARQTFSEFMKKSGNKKLYAAALAKLEKDYRQGKIVQFKEDGSVSKIIYRDKERKTAFKPVQPAVKGTSIHIDKLG